jgi:protein tyrosine phosphatase (PTP) superfamily phosphohydrolase (DUF442 family)
VAVAVLAGAWAGACTPAPRGVAAGLPPREGGPAVRRADVPGLENLGRVDAGLWRSAQPTAEGFRSARALGVRTVLNLRSGHDDGPLAREAGLEVVTLATHPWSVDEADLLAALRVLTDPARRPVLVHCAQGRDRTGAVVAAYRRVVHGWDADRAIAEMEEFGMGRWWVQLPGLVRGLDAAAVRAMLPAAPLPAVGLADPPAAGR